jgi:hypothetical protein
MSLREKHHKPTTQQAIKLNREIAHRIAVALRADYGNKYSSIKQISKHTQASLSTIKKWFDGHNPPNSANLITLARRSPSVLRVVLELIENPTELSVKKEVPPTAVIAALPAFYSEKSFGINVRVDFAVGSQLNARQLWFLGLLQQDHKLKAEHIAVTWCVTHRTGESDIAELMRLKLVRFTGTKKAGHYEISGC